MGTENSGAISRGFDTTLRHYGKLATATGSSTDFTVYGATRASTHDHEHYQQHLAEIAHAIGFAHVSTIHAAEAAHLSALLMTVGY